jgi:hypothetical protein
MKNIVVVALILLTAQVMVSAQGVGKGRPLAVIQLETHPGGTYMMTMKAAVNGKQGLFMFDTGGGVSYIDPTFSRSIGCEPWGQISGFTLTGQRLDMQRCDGLRFDVAGRSLAAPIAGVFDIGKFMPAGAPHIDGSIGLDVFAGQAITLSVANKQLTVESPKTLASRMKNGKEVPIRMVREVEGIALSVVVGVPTGKGMAWMELDSGNGGANVVGKHLASIMNLDPDKKEPQETSFQIAGGVNVDGPARVNPTLTMDGNIGTRFLINWDLTLDLARGRAWLAQVSKN